MDFHDIICLPPAGSETELQGVAGKASANNDNHPSSVDGDRNPGVNRAKAKQNLQHASRLSDNGFR